MLTLKTREPKWVTLTAPGAEPSARLLLKPYSSLGIAYARRKVSDAINAGVDPLEAAETLTIHLGAWAALEWEGVGDEAGEPLERTKENVAAILEQDVTAYDAVDREYVIPALLEEQEKNASSPLLDGTSPAGAVKSKKTKRPRSRGAGGTTAKGAGAAAKPAPTA